MNDRPLPAAQDAGMLDVHEPLDAPGPAGRWHVTRAASAVTGAFLATRRETAGRQLAKDVLSDFTDIFKSMAVRYQPLADNANADEAKFEKWARLAVDCAARAAPFQSPTFRAVTVVPPDKTREDDVTVIDLKIFDHTGTAVGMATRSAQEE